MSMPSRAAVLALLGLPVVAACESSNTKNNVANSILDDSGQLEPIEVPPAARSALARDGQVRLLVELAPVDLPVLHRGQSRADQLRVRSLRKKVLDTEVQTLMTALPTTARIARSYDQIPLVALDLRQAASLDALAHNPRVVGFHLDERLETTLASSLPLIQQPEAEAAGFTGAGTAVAVLDTGIDHTHSQFGSCTAVGTPSTCRVVENIDIATDDGELDDHGHGTNVAAIVGGVAPGTDLIGLDVFRTDGYAYTSDVVGAIDWVVENADEYNIVALNMSLGGGRYTDTCTYSAYELAIGIAESAGIGSAVATGNDGWTNSISSPACAPSAIKVGAVYSKAYSGISWSGCTDTDITADQVTCFSNSASFIDLLAPGAIISAGGYQMGGTSQATPHVAGALAVLAEAWPTEGPEDWLARLQDTGTDITDDRNGLSFPRIDVGEAVADAAVGEPPTVSLSLNGGDDYTDGRVVDAVLEVTAGSATVTEMCLANADDGLPSCTSWQALDTELPWQTSAGQGDKTVAVWVRDSSGQASEPATADITLDTIAPTSGELSASASDGTVSLSWTAGTDAGSGVSSYALRYQAGATASGDCSAGTLAYEGSARSTSVAGLSGGGTYSFQLCVTDAAGNEAVGDSATVTGDGSVTGALTINGGAAWTDSRSVELSLDADGAAEMCLSNTPRCAEEGWQPYTQTYAWSLPDVEGPRTVSVWFRSADGTESDAATADIGLDRSVPLAGAVSARARFGDGRVVLRLQGFSDETSGIASYKVHSWVFGSAPTTCTEDAEEVPADVPRVVLERSVGLLPVQVAVCAVDAAGNMSAPAMGTAQPR